MNSQENWPIVSSKEIKIVNKVLKSNKLNYWTGTNCTNFEKEFSNKFKIKYSISLANGSVGLDIAIKSLKLKKNSEIIVTPRSYISSVTSVINQGLKPIFADIDLNSQNIEAKNIEKKITKNTKAVVVVHLGGMPSNMIKIKELAKKYNLKIIEDCSQAHGAKINNKYVGTFGDVSVWSFCNDKILNTLGEGGIVATKNRNNFKNLWSLKDCGKNYSKLRKKKRQFKFRWVHDFEGTNLRMTEVQAAVGRYQLKQLDKWIKKRNINSIKINKVCEKFRSIKTQKTPKNFTNAYYRCYVFLRPNFIKKGWTREKILKYLNKIGLYCDVGSCPEIYKEKFLITNKLVSSKELENASLVGKTSIAFKVSPNIYESKFNLKMIKLKNFLKEITI